MFKKGFALMMVGLLSAILSTAAFASIQLNPVDDVMIEINEPKIGSERQVFIKGSMAISIRAYGEQDVDMSLYKVMPSIDDDIFEDVADSDMILYAEDMPFEVVSGGSIVAREIEDADSEADTEELLEAAERSEDTEKTDSIIDGAEALLQKEKISSKDRQEIIKSYTNIKEDLEDQVEDLASAFDEAEALLESDEIVLEALSEDETDQLVEYLEEAENTKELLKEYEAARKAYKAIFEVPIFGPENLMDTKIPTFFQKTVEKITPGVYRMVFTSTETGEEYDIIEFEVTKELTEEDIKEVMPKFEELILPGGNEEDEAPAVEQNNSDGGAEEEELELNEEDTGVSTPVDTIEDSNE
jgi:hypothetical protein